MADEGLKLTKAGLLLLAKAQTGVALKFTRVTIGDGTLPAGQNLTDLTALISPKMTLPIVGIKAEGGGESTISCRVQNATLETEFFFRETGVFATDPDVGEILYAVENRGDNATHMPSCQGSRRIDFVYNLVTVIGQATSVTAEINSNLVFALNVDVLAHINSTDPHHAWLQKLAATPTPSHFWGQSGSDGHLHPVAVDDAKKLILGGDGSDISALRSNDATLFRAVQEAALQREADGLAPGWSLIFGENFEDCDALDVFACAVQSVAGDDTILVDSVKGLLTGSWYTISDGVNQELIQIKSIIKNGSDLRVIATQDLANTYQQGKTSMYRSTAQITTSAGMALGAGDQRAKTWAPTVTFTGVTGNVVQTAALDTSLTNQALTVTGDGAFTADGYFTLK